VLACLTLRRTIGKPLPTSPNNADHTITKLCSEAMADAQGLKEAQRDEPPHVSDDLMKRLETAISTLGSTENPAAHFRFGTKLDQAGLRYHTHTHTHNRIQITHIAHQKSSEVGSGGAALPHAHTHTHTTAYKLHIAHQKSYTHAHTTPMQQIDHLLTHSQTHTHTHTHKHTRTYTNTHTHAHAHTRTTHTHT